ncbi:2-C-methyl-D-erythritol 2,4-cyclodiphosphate synthase [Candidatus Arsenophonus lipoptenae]|uniref:2-C-methyl-D-erythritol 2,4-cyclodiphosphate synthase n=1 Tax=Candidatus Arsenophonus lipoptenae TaxID=634113 RepID=A0A0X9VMV5_9GAMM|nr:2-C-methyl-D-erythritol 2,4-cyclodiphosphate synthase [Candidatus Arsenophonus lipoptenae]AMA65076.1 2-C-methyl-D-erythritol 2,4-cyclodiphosphate synthase [Candidatus Arsenophonus lipoptenae]
MRIGHGFDIHKFGGKDPIILCGVKIPYEQGIIAYSDGDVALHSLIDAILGASALGDIGKLFPDTNPTFKKADSRSLLCQAYSYVLKKGYIINNIDITIITEVPKILPYFFEMRKNISSDLGCHIDDINVKSTTTETLGFIGMKKGIACTSVVLLVNNNK